VRNASVTGEHVREVHMELLQGHPHLLLQVVNFARGANDQRLGGGWDPIRQSFACSS